MNRSDFQKLARLRIKEAKHLMDGGYYDGAYYLAGYAIECALKACIAKRTKQYDFPPPRKVIENVYSHDLEKLAGVAGLQIELDEEAKMKSILAENWAQVLRWSEQSRYNIRVSEVDAAQLLEAITSPTDGVLSWLKERW